jgi:hypothetical protein
LEKITIRQPQVHGGQDQASYDVTAEFSKWWETSEKSIFYFETEKAYQVDSCELPEAAAGTQNSWKLRSSRRLVEFRSGRQSL